MNKTTKLILMLVAAIVVLPIVSVGGIAVITLVGNSPTTTATTSVYDVPPPKCTGVTAWKSQYGVCETAQQHSDEMGRLWAADHPCPASGWDVCPGAPEPAGWTLARDATLSQVVEQATPLLTVGQRQCVEGYLLQHWTFVQLLDGATPLQNADRITEASDACGWSR
jgi:hypothetical protein